MLVRYLTLLSAASAALAASPRQGHGARHHGGKHGGSPCAAVSSSAAAVLAASPSATPTVDGQLAYDCLNSVPLHKKEALELLDSILPYVEWQSDPTYLKAPPSGYQEPAVDLDAAFHAVREKIEHETYRNEYEFQADLFRTFNLAHDGHFRFFPDLLTKALSFTRGVGLVSVSLDGAELPQPYVYDDITAMVAGQLKNPSPITKINGQEAVTYLENWGQLGALQDPDALYNTVFFSEPFAASGPGWQGYFAGSGRFGYIWPEAKTALTFANGTTKEYHTTAKVIGSFSGVTDAESMYEVFCNPVAPAAPAPAALPSSIPSVVPSPPAPGYPTPIVISSDKTISGYFLESVEGCEDVAVLAMTSFEPNIPAEFQAVLQTFLAEAKAAGKTKIVIDVGANGGGIILQGYDTFRQFFPQITQDGYTRFRNHPAWDVIAEQLAVAIPADYNPETASADLINLYETPLNYRYDLNFTDHHFESLAEKDGPFEYNGDKYTNLMRWDLNDPLTTVNATFGVGMEITGYGTRRNFTQPFDSVDIVILYDGYCASTCTLFSEFMRLQGNVKSIAIGGRPSKDGMQAIGGVKGANNFGMDYINQVAQATYQTGTEAQQKQESWKLLTDLGTLPVNRSTDTSINVRDNILPANLEDGVPAQFIYEKADCRLFYEPAMITDISKMWQAAADAAWGGKSCVEGSLDLPKRSVSDKAKRSTGAGVGKAIEEFRSMEFEPLTKAAWWGTRHGESVPL